jgi:type 1 glutamine amidotransferase
VPKLWLGHADRIEEKAMKRRIALWVQPARGLSLASVVLLLAATFVATAFCAEAAEQSGAAKKKIVLIAGGPSHGYFSHTHYAGCVLLAKALNENVPGVEAVVVRNGWPKDPAILDDAAAVVLFSDGGGGNPLLGHLEQLDRLMGKGVGLALLHYAVEVPKEKAGKQLLDWTGGYYEAFWSVNPTFTARFDKFPEHPVTRGVKPFEMLDEWYYHMRFRENMEGVVPVLSTVPPDSTRMGPDSSHGGNPTVRSRKGLPEHLAWARQRPDGGRGFGFTGGHFHYNWANDGFRTIVLNGIVWVAGLEVPAGGVPSKAPTLEELEANQDYPQPENFSRGRIEKILKKWRQEAGQGK